MSKYLHVIGTSNLVAKHFPNFISENFPAEEHSFLIIGDKVSPKELPDGAAIIPSYDRKAVISHIRKSTYVFFHGLSLSTVTKLQLLLPGYRKKLIWVAWGADLYEGHTQKGIIQKTKRCIDRLFKARILHFVGIFKPDIDYFRKKYGSKAQTFFAKYAAGSQTRNPVYNEPPVLRTCADRIRDGQTINIVIGHQANPLLNHCTVLDWLSRFIDENIHIYLPLSYGDAENAQQVSEYAQQLFGNKVTVLRDYLSLREYMDILKDMDIAIFHIDRQIGLGNIYPLMYMQKKIYMKSDGVMYRYFKSEGIDIFPSEQLQDITFHEFVRDANMSNATQFIIELQDTDANRSRWQTVFSSLQ